MQTTDLPTVKRYFGMDIHRDYAVLVAVSGPNQVTMAARRVDYPNSQPGSNKTSHPWMKLRLKQR